MEKIACNYGTISYIWGESISVTLTFLQHRFLLPGYPNCEYNTSSTNNKCYNHRTPQHYSTGGNYTTSIGDWHLFSHLYYLFQSKASILSLVGHAVSGLPPC